MSDHIDKWWDENGKHFAKKENCTWVIQAPKAMLRAYDAELQGTIKALQDQYTQVVDENITKGAQLAAAQQDSARLREALARYGLHDNDCPGCYNPMLPGTKCDCGLDAAMQPAQEAKP